MMNDKLFEKILDACDKASDMVCDLQDLAWLSGWHGFDDLPREICCNYIDGLNPIGCLKCMAEVAEWLKSEGVI